MIAALSVSSDQRITMMPGVVGTIRCSDFNGEIYSMENMKYRHQIHSDVGGHTKSRAFSRLSRLWATVTACLIMAVTLTSVGRPQSDYQAMFDKAVEVIKKYETLHSARHWPLIGYGHKVQPGEKYKRGVVLSEKEADALLRKDLKKFIEYFKDQGDQAIVLGTLAYNIGPGNVKKSSVYSKIKAGNHDVYASYIRHSKCRGKTRAPIKKRREEEYAFFK